MRVGVLTLPLHHNYGGILQAYALQRSLSQLGFEAYLINRLHPSKQRRLKDGIARLIHILILETHTRRFIRKYLKPRTGAITTESDMQDVVRKYSLDAIVVGSDQVWRLEYSLDIAFNFFLDFVGNSALKKIAYAASFGVDHWSHPDATTSRIRDLLARLDVISVREDSGVAICRDSFGVDAVQMIDPTLLLRRDDYLKLIGDVTDEISPKVLTFYLIDRSEEKMEVVRKVAARTGLLPRSISVKMRFSERTSPRVWDCVYPKVTDWIRGFQDAGCVVTDSFHGVLFCLIFNRPFVAVGNDARGLARFQSTLELFHLSNRLVTNASEVSDELLDENIDFGIVNEIREAKRSEALQFLTQSLAI